MKTEQTINSAELPVVPDCVCTEEPDGTFTVSIPRDTGCSMPYSGMCLGFTYDGRAVFARRSGSTTVDVSFGGFDYDR